MSETLNENNPQKSQHPNVSLEECTVQPAEKEILRKFEEDKTRKEKYKEAHPPWSAEDWNAARAGKGLPTPWFSIIVNDFMTPEKVQEICDLSSPPEVGWLTTAPYENDYASKPEKLPYCAVQGRKASNLVIGSSHGDDVIVWFQGKRRAAWIASEQGPEDEAEMGPPEETENAETGE